LDKKEWQEKGAGHRARLRDRFLANGLQTFSDAEILELLLSFGTPRSDCKQQARQLLEKFGSFAKVLEASPASLQEVKGVGPKNAFALQFVRATASHYLRQRLTGKRYLHSSSEVVDYLLFSLKGLKKEVLQVIFLDSSHSIITARTMSEGTLNVNTVYPREIIKMALELHAAAIILAHNHPSGSLSPSTADFNLTKTLCLLCLGMQIQLLDHILIGDGHYSFADKGDMSDIVASCKSSLAQVAGQ